VWSAAVTVECPRGRARLATFDASSARVATLAAEIAGLDALRVVEAVSSAKERR
jgi:hypothetical protein